MIDFTNVPIDIKSNYSGSDQKRGVVYHNKRFMLKLSDRIDTAKKNNMMDSYSNSVFSEYVCCHILALCGMDVQNTLLGTIVMDTKKHKDMVVPVVACENFIPEGYALIEFKNIQNAIQVEKPERTPKLKEIYNIFTNENIYFNKRLGQQALERYWDTFIFDALFGNFDRHGNNWGYLINDLGEIKLAPIYDCGSCLYPQVSDDAIPSILNNQSEIQKRIDTFPKAALLLDNGEKVNYRKYINSLQNDDCTAALSRVYPTIDMTKINEFIDKVDGISDIRKTFYKTMLKIRYDLILTSAYTQIQDNPFDGKTYIGDGEYRYANFHYIRP